LIFERLTPGMTTTRDRGAVSEGPMQDGVAAGVRAIRDQD
jgi:hypothetical protein